MSWTGANVGWLFAAGLGLVLAGGLFAVVSRRRGEAGADAFGQNGRAR